MHAIRGGADTVVRPLRYVPESGSDGRLVLEDSVGVPSVAISESKVAPSPLRQEYHLNLPSLAFASSAAGASSGSYLASGCVQYNYMQGCV
eukprot:6172542-Pleurochrysis_carterae.AAC.2